MAGRQRASREKIIALRKMTILKADPEYRRKFLLLYGLLAVIGLGVICWGAPLLEKLDNAKKSPQKRSVSCNYCWFFCFCLYYPSPIIPITWLGR